MIEKVQGTVENRAPQSARPPSVAQIMVIGNEVAALCEVMSVDP
jgi:hypothetical protein